MASCLRFGRVRSLIPGTRMRGHRAAAIYSLVNTGKLNGIDPQSWLADVLHRIQDYPAKNISQLLPWHWTNARYRDAA